jgi:hypothetical protein
MSSHDTSLFYTCKSGSSTRTATLSGSGIIKFEPKKKKKNSDVDIPLNPNHAMPSVNKSPVVAALPRPPEQISPLILENTSERIPPSFSRRHEVIASSNNRSSGRGSPPITDTRDDALLYAPLDVGIATDTCPTPKEPAMELLPLTKQKRKSQVNSVGDETGEQLPLPTGDGNNQLEPRISSHISLSRPPNIHRPTSETISEFRREEHRRGADPGGSNHPEPHVTARIPLSRPPHIHRPTSETISEFRREEYRAGADAGGDTHPEWQLSSHTPLSQPSNAHWSTSDTILEVRREEYGTDADASGYSHFGPDVSSRIPLSRTLNDHRPISDMISEVRREESRTIIDARRGGKTKNN